MVNSIRKAMTLFDVKDKRKLVVLLLMMIIAALFETLGIGLIIPFVGIITNPEVIQDITFLSNIYSFLGFESTNSFVIFSVITFLFIYIFKNMYLLIFEYAQYKLIFNQEIKLSERLFKTYLIKPYTFHLQRNSADLLRNITIEVPKIFRKVIISSFQLATEILVASFILTLLFFVSPIATLTASIILCGSIFTFFKFYRTKISKLGEEEQDLNGSMIKWVKQGLGAGKEVRVTGKEGYFVNEYANLGKTIAVNNRSIKMLEYAPRPFIETLLISIVLVTMLIIFYQNLETTQVVSTMALFCMAAFRLLPSINRILFVITTIRYNYPALSIVYEDIEKNEVLFPQNTHVKDKMESFEKTYKGAISLTNVSFRYPNDHALIIKDVSLTIPIGSAAAFIGKSGAGKTTIVDLILGLLTPEKGKITIDGKDIDEQRSILVQKIGYIPQTIFLSDDTIRNNVAFGLVKADINDEEVWRALEQAQLKEYVRSLPAGLDTMVGERGLRLSGGQRQRIGIARALYTNPEIIFMDEATSAVDSETENEIMRAIDLLKGQKTLIIIAHRLSTIKNCDFIFEMENGEVTSVEKNFKDWGQVHA
ncbi:ABC transporter ATP-binding protein [Alkalihalobacillus sp. R86527]|uniref:ABC transporter ATP-binding protein n=1 Tax=Alkalihalobacillus sp. R86527 TaxID=3093863 RepID=UPI00366D389A